jgi:hypothetical protein
MAEVERYKSVSVWIVTLLGGAGAIWAGILSAFAYAVRARD